MSGVNQSTYQPKSQVTSHPSTCLSRNLITELTGSNEKNKFDTVTASSHSQKIRELKRNEIISDSTNTSNGGKKYKASCSFPNTLMEILSNDVLVESIHWCPDGEAFEISNPTKFASDILPIYFKNTKYDSFVRKLYRWGFRMKSMHCRNVFYHSKFRRHSKELIPQMQLQYSPKELRVKRTKKCIRRSSIVRMLETDQSSCAIGIEANDSINQVPTPNLMLHSPLTNDKPSNIPQYSVQDPSVTYPNPQLHAKTNGITHNMSLHLPQTGLVYLPSVSLLHPSQLVPLPTVLNQPFSFNPVLQPLPLINNIPIGIISEFQVETNTHHIKK